MAQIDYNFPRVDFSPLANLPNAIEEGRQRAARQQLSLANLDLSSSGGLSKAASLAARLGDWDTALKLSSQSTARKSAEQRGADIEAWNKFIRGGGATGTMAPPTMPDISVGSPESATSAPSGPPRMSPETFQNMQFPVGPRAEAPVPETPPEGQGPIKLAGPMPTADTGASPIQLPPVNVRPPGAAEPPPSPVGGGFAPPDPTKNILPPMPTPVTQPGTPAQEALPPPRPLTQRDLMTPSQQEGYDTLVRIGDTPFKFPRGSQSTPAFQATMAKARDAMRKMHLSPEMESYTLDRIQFYQRTGQDLSHEDWKRQNAVAADVYKNALKVAEDQRVKGDAAEKLLDTLKRAEQIAADPQYKTGKFAQKYTEAVANAHSALQVASDFLPAGYGKAMMDRVNSVAAGPLRSAALTEEMRALGNKALLDSVGSLAKTFSEGDRLFTEKIFDFLSRTPQGLALIVDDLKQVAAHAQALSKVTRNYMGSTERGARSTPWGLENAQEQYAMTHPIFTKPNGDLTPLGKKIEEKLKGADQAPLGTGVPAPAQKVLKYNLNTRKFE